RRRSYFLQPRQNRRSTQRSHRGKRARLTSQWDYRPRKPIRARAALDSPSIETSDGLSSDPFEVNNNVWFHDNSLEDAASTFVSGPTETEETITEALSQTTDPVCSGPNVEDAAV